MTKTPLSTVLAAALLAAAIAAGPASAAAPSITTDAVDEGVALTLPVSHTCKVKKGCTYTVRTVDGTANAGSDYTAATATGRARKKATFTTTLTVPTTADTACEPSETFSVHVDVTNKKGTSGFDATETIVDKNCGAPAPATTTTTPAENGPPARFSNPAGAVIDNRPRAPYQITQTCDTQMGIGAQAQAPLTGLVLDPCHVAVQCPPTGVQYCAGIASNRITGQDPKGIERVVAPLFILHYRGNTGPQTDTDVCQDFGSCTASQTAIRVQPGDWMMVECHGRHDPDEVRPGNDRKGSPVPMNLSCEASLSLVA
jgi:hypothetical protein